MWVADQGARKPATVYASYATVGLETDDWKPHSAVVYQTTPASTDGLMDNRHRFSGNMTSGSRRFHVEICLDISGYTRF